MFKISTKKSKFQNFLKPPLEQ